MGSNFIGHFGSSGNFGFSDDFGFSVDFGFSDDFGFVDSGLYGAFDAGGESLNGSVELDAGGVSAVKGQPIVPCCTPGSQTRFSRTLLSPVLRSLVKGDRPNVSIFLT